MITNTDNVIDSRDIIERIEELQELYDETLENDPSGSKLALWLQGDDGTEYRILTTLAEECSDYAVDWEHGEALIHEDYFEQYMDEMIDDCEDIPKNLPSYLIITVDYDALKMDYTEVDFDGETYYIRCV